MLRHPQDVLREAGCLGQLNRLVSSVMTPSDLLTPLLQSINNMAMNTDNQKELQVSISFNRLPLESHNNEHVGLLFGMSMRL